MDGTPSSAYSTRQDRTDNSPPRHPKQAEESPGFCHGNSYQILHETNRNELKQEADKGRRGEERKTQKQPSVEQLSLHRNEQEEIMGAICHHRTGVQAVPPIEALTHSLDHSYLPQDLVGAFLHWSSLALQDQSRRLIRSLVMN